MRKNYPIIFFLMSVTLLSSFFNVRAQTYRYQLYVTNQIQVDPYTYRYDVYMLSNGSGRFKYGMFQFGLGFDTSIINGGALSVSLLPGSSQLVPSQVPTTIVVGSSTHIVDGIAYRYINQAAMPNPGIANCTVISDSTTGCSAPGTRLGTYQLTNTVPFRSGSSCKHIFHLPTLTDSISTGTLSTRLAVALLGYTISPLSTTPFTPQGQFFNYNTVGTCDQDIEFNTCQALGAIISNTGVSCYGGSNGEVEISLSGIGSFSQPGTYSLDSGPPLPYTTNPFIISGLAAGNHSVVITPSDASCFGSSVSFTISGPVASISSTSSVTACPGSYLPWGQLVYTSGTYSHTYTSASGCDSLVTLFVTINNFPPAQPGPITQTLIDNSCGARIYRFSVNPVPNATSYVWNFSSHVGGLLPSVTVDSGSLSFSRVIRLKFASNSAATTNGIDRIEVYSVKGLCYSNNFTSAYLNNIAWVPLPNPSITATVVSVNTCGSRRIRYSVPIPATTSGTVGFEWSLVGNGLASGAYIDSGTSTSRVIVVRFTNNGSSNSSDSIRFRYNYNSGCSYGTYVTSNIVLSDFIQPAPPLVTASAFVQNVCGGRKVRYSVPIIPGATSTAVAAVGYNWMLAGTGLHSSAGSTYVIDSMDASGLTASRAIVIRYLSDSARSADSISCAYTSDCGTGMAGPAVFVPLTSPVTVNSAPVITPTPLVRDSCGNRIIRYSVPLVTNTTAAAVTGYSWSFTGPALHAGMGSTYLIDSAASNGAGGFNLAASRVIKVKYLVNSASSTLDSVRCAYISTCGMGRIGGVRPVLSSLSTPTPSSVTATIIMDSSRKCFARTVRYSVPSVIKTPTTALVTGYAWSFVGTVLHSGLGVSYVIDSMNPAGLSASRVIRVRYLNNSVAALTDSVRCAYITNCGMGFNARVRVPFTASTSNMQYPSPGSVSSAILVNNVCSGRVVRYSVPQAPVSSTAAAFTGYGWQFTGSVLHAGLGITYVIDSMDAAGLAASNVILVRYLSNSSRSGDTVRCGYMTACGISGLAKLAVPLSTATPQPAAPTISHSAVLQNLACGGRKVRYAVPDIPGVTATAAAATGYSWSFVGTGLHSASGTTYVIDSGAVTSRQIIVRYISNAARNSNDSVRCAYTSACGTGTTGRLLVPLPTPIAQPGAPVISATTLIKNQCRNRKVRYSVPALPPATATAPAATGYSWSFIGSRLHASLGLSYVIDSGTVNGRSLVIRYLNDSVQAENDSVRCAYISPCGTGVPGRSRVGLLTSVIPPLAPSASAVIQTLVKDSCGRRYFRYAAPLLPVIQTDPVGFSLAPATGYNWVLPSGALTGILDSGTLSGRVILVRYNSNATATSGDSIRMGYTSSCEGGAVTAYFLANTESGMPAKPVPAAGTPNVVSTACGARILRYSVVQAPGVFYNWRLSNSLSAAGAVIDSGGTGNVIRVRIVSAAASALTDTVFAFARLGCNNISVPLSFKVSVIACTPIGRTYPSTRYDDFEARVYPNPARGNVSITATAANLERIEVRIFDIQGRAIINKCLMPGEILNIGAMLQPGNYLIQMRQGKREKIKKLFIY